MTIPSDVVTKPWLQPRVWVSAKTLLVSCCILHLLRLSVDAGSLRLEWLVVNEGAIHFLSRNR